MTDSDSPAPTPKPVSPSTTIGVGFARSDSDDRMMVAVFLGGRVAILSPEGARTLALQLVQNAAHVGLWAAEYAADEAARSASGTASGHVWEETQIVAKWLVGVTADEAGAPAPASDDKAGA